MCLKMYSVPITSSLISPKNFLGRYHLLILQGKKGRHRGRATFSMSLSPYTQALLSTANHTFCSGLKFHFCSIRERILNIIFIFHSNY